MRPTDQAELLILSLGLSGQAFALDRKSSAGDPERNQNSYAQPNS